MGGIPEKGIGTGSILSPLLANVVLNELDWWVAYRPSRKRKEKDVHLVRYADDITLVCKSYEAARQVYVDVKQWLQENLYLDLKAQEKVIYKLHLGSAEFLGFKITVKRKAKQYIMKSRIMDATRERALRTIKKKIIMIKIRQSIESVNHYNTVVKGLQEYFKLLESAKYDFRDMEKSANTLLTDMLQYVKKHSDIYRENGS